MKTDPVCGMEVKDDTEYSTLHGVRKMFFCSHECQQKFIRNPDQYLKGEEKKGSKKAA